MKSTDCRPECRSVLDFACGNADAHFERSLCTVGSFDIHVALCLEFPCVLHTRIATSCVRSSKQRGLVNLTCVRHKVYHDLVAKTISEDTAGKPCEEGLGVSSPMKGTAHLTSIRKYHPSEDIQHVFTLSVWQEGEKPGCSKKQELNSKPLFLISFLTGAYLAHETRKVREAEPIFLRTPSEPRIPLARLETPCCQSRRQEGHTKLWCRQNCKL